jgi:hypothetical protein
MDLFLRDIAVIKKTAYWWERNGKMERVPVVQIDFKPTPLHSNQLILEEREWMELRVMISDLFIDGNERIEYLKPLKTIS